MAIHVEGEIRTKELIEYARIFRGEIGVMKLGMEILTNALFAGSPVFDAVKDVAFSKVMLDLKYGDIPATVAGAAMAVAKRGRNLIFGFTVHCLSGKKALRNAVMAVRNNFGGIEDDPLVIEITILTSLDQSDLNELGINGTPKEAVLRLASIAAEAGVPAIVCSPQETKDVLSINPNFIVINPGIRFAGSDIGTQKRVTTPKEAIVNGASYIVMGSDLRKGNPVDNARRAAAEIKEGLKQIGQPF